MEKIPHELLVGVVSFEERAARLGRWAIMQELGFFGEDTNLLIAKGEYEGTFIGNVRKRFNGIYGDVRGCEPGDIENAALYLNVFDDVFDLEASQSSKYLRDKSGKAD